MKTLLNKKSTNPTKHMSYINSPHFPRHTSNNNKWAKATQCQNVIHLSKLKSHNLAQKHKLRTRTHNLRKEREMLWDLEGVLESARSPEISGDATEFRKGNCAAFANPFLQNIGDASLREAQPENSALQIVFLIFWEFVHAPFLCGREGFFFDGFDAWREGSRQRRSCTSVSSCIPTDKDMKFPIQSGISASGITCWRLGKGERCTEWECGRGRGRPLICC